MINDILKIFLKIIVRNCSHVLACYCPMGSPKYSFSCFKRVVGFLCAFYSRMVIFSETKILDTTIYIFSTCALYSSLTYLGTEFRASTLPSSICPPHLEFPSLSMSLIIFYAFLEICPIWCVNTDLLACSQLPCMLEILLYLMLTNLVLNIMTSVL